MFLKAGNRQSRPAGRGAAPKSAPGAFPPPLRLTQGQRALLARATGPQALVWRQVSPRTFEAAMPQPGPVWHRAKSPETTMHQPSALCSDTSRYEVLAHELHDSVAQQLGFLAFQARRIETLLEKPSRAAPLVAELRSVLSRVQKQVRELITGARIGMQGRTLREALADAVDEFSRRSSIIFELDNRLPDQTLAPDSELQVLQIVREALANVVRHSQARQVRIELRPVPGQKVVVMVEDDGIGMDPGAAPGPGEHYGLAIMRERAGAIGATLTIEAPPLRGARIVLCAPYGAAP